MKTRVQIGEPVKQFVLALAPEPRRKTWRAIKDLADGAGDVLQLEGSLTPFFRLRVGRIRVVFAETSTGGERVLNCFFADYRSTVYQALEQMIASGLLDELKR